MGRTHRYEEQDEWVDQYQEAMDDEAAMYFQESELAIEARREAEMEARCAQAEEERDLKEWLASDEGKASMALKGRLARIPVCLGVVRLDSDEDNIPF